MLNSWCLRIALIAFSSVALAHPDDLEQAVQQPFSGAGLADATPVVPEQPAGQSLPLQGGRKVEFETDEGTWLSLDLSPNGRTLVFDMLGDLWTMDWRGGQARPITTGIAFDSQPVYAPDGNRLAFLSDRSGSENLWVARPDGSDARQISFIDDNTTFISPAWTPDGKFVFVTRFKPDSKRYELWKYDIDGTIAPEQIGRGDGDKDKLPNALGPVVSGDGKYLYFGQNTTGYDEHTKLPLWSIARRDLTTGAMETVVTNVGSAMRPALSPDGASMVYAARTDGKTGLRLRDMKTGQDRWLAHPVQHDNQEGGVLSRDTMPRYVFTPDGKSLMAAWDGKIRRIDIDTGTINVVPFRARVSLDAGPSLRRSIHDETGPVQARLIQEPVQSPDGKRVVFSALTRLYVMDLPGGTPRRLTDSNDPEFQPSWSPDGSSIAYVTWRARGGGDVWIVPADGSAKPRRITQIPDSSWAYPVFLPDGSAIVAQRSSNYARMQQYMEFGFGREVALLRVPAGGGEAATIASGHFVGKTQLSAAGDKAFLNFADGLHEIALDGSSNKRVVTVKGPGWYFVQGTALVDGLKISPDGKYLLAQIAQQLHLLEMPAGDAPTVELGLPSVRHRKLTSVGADFFEWADGGRTITWAVGSTFYRQPLDAIALDPANAKPLPGERPQPGQKGVEEFHAKVEVPRDIPRATTVLRGGTVITMKGEEVIADADVVIVDNKIQAVGRRGTVAVPANAAIRDVKGKFIMPGLIDIHAHWAQVRRGILDDTNWGFAANLAYGITAGIDVSSLSIDIFAYQDMIDAGMLPGLRTFSTGTAIFSFNEFQSKDEAVDVLTRYRRHYRTENLKMYRTGNRRVRQWVAQAAAEVGMMPTAEGAGDAKMDLTQITDGFGNEHALMIAPLSNDVVQLFTQTRANYSLTLQLAAGGPPSSNVFNAKTPPRGDPKAERFLPKFYIESKMIRRYWNDPLEYQYGRMAEGGAAIQRAGGLLGIGSHSEVEGLGYHWELQAHAAGGMRPHEILQAATIGSAEVMGHQDELGSIEPGKFADLLVLDRNPLEKIENTLSVRQVMKNGRLYNADTLDEIWPRQKKLEPLWFWDDRPAKLK